MAHDKSRDRAADAERNMRVKEVIIHIKSGPDDYYVVLQGGSTDAIATDLHLGHRLSNDMGGGNPGYGLPSSAKIYPTCPCCTGAVEVPRTSVTDQPDCCYLVNGSWVCW